MSIGSRMRSINICAVERILSASKGPFGEREGVWIASFNRWDTASAARLRVASWTSRLNAGNRCASAIVARMSATKSSIPLFSNGRPEARELVLSCPTFGHVTAEIRQTIDDARHNCSEQRLFTREVPVDRWLAGRS